MEYPFSSMISWAYACLRLPMGWYDRVDTRQIIMNSEPGRRLGPWMQRARKSSWDVSFRSCPWWVTFHLRVLSSNNSAIPYKDAQISVATKEFRETFEESFYDLSGLKQFSVDMWAYFGIIQKGTTRDHPIWWDDDKGAFLLEYTIPIWCL